MRSSSHFYHFTFSVLFLLGFSLSSHAATIIPGGTTTVAINSDTLNALLPLNPAPLGDATLTPPDAIFPITGGITLAGSGSSIIRHDNSGLGFSLNDDALNLTDFVINTGSGVLTGTVSGLIDGGAFDLGAGIPLFNIGPGLALSLTVEAGDAFDTVFGVPGLAGVELGQAQVSVVPIPAAAWLFISGLGMLSLRRKNS